MWEEDFEEAFRRYMSRSDMDALKASLQARQASLDSQKKAGSGEQKKDEPGEAQGGAAEAA